MRNLLIAAGAAGAAALAAAAGAPAFAQTVEELTVIGQWNGRGEPPARLSRVVSYTDLDLRNAADQAELRRRIDVTARDICDELGEDRGNAGALGPSCRQRAVDDAMRQVRVAVAQAYSVPPAYAVVGAAADTAYVAPAGPTVDASDAASPDVAAPPASYTTSTVTNGPVADTAANRARFGGPMSNAGKRTPASGD
jgi:UrcA family protein